MINFDNQIFVLRQRIETFINIYRLHLKRVEKVYFIFCYKFKKIMWNYRMNIIEIL